MEKLKKELVEFFLIFGAEQGLSEIDIEKLQRILHQLDPKNMKEVQDFSSYIVQNNLLDEPEEVVMEKLASRIE